MKESFGEGLANQTSLKACGNCCNALAEALTQAIAGGLSNSEIISFQVPTTLPAWEGNTYSSDIKRAVARPGGVLEPGMYGYFLHGNREIRGIF